jgi:predicted ATPase
VVAACLALFRAVVFAVLVGSLLVKRMAASNLGALFFELGVSSLRLREDIFVVVKRLRHGSRFDVLVLVASPLSIIWLDSKRRKLTESPDDVTDQSLLLGGNER